MLSNSPTDTSELTSDEPPKLMKGSGTPVKGMVDVITATLIIAWSIIKMVMPPATNMPKRSGALRAMR